MENKNKTLLHFFISLLVFKLFAFTMLYTFSPEFIQEKAYIRIPASDNDDCAKAAVAIIKADEVEPPIKIISIDESVVKDATKKFWANKDGTFIGASYFKTKKAIFNKIKLAFMDINSNFRPVYYIEDDEASYPKIFKFIEAKASKAADEDPSSVEKEIMEWMSVYKSYDKDMENLVSEYAILAQYVKQIRELKENKYLQFPFEIELNLLKEGKELKLKDYIGGPDDLSNVIFKLKGKMKKLKGTSYFRFGAIDTRDFEQALMATRLKSLENEIRNHLAAHPNDEEKFKALLKELISINRDPQYSATLKFMAKLEYKEMDAEYRDLFKNAETDFKKIDEAAKDIIKNLSPRYQEKLGLNAVKNWVTVMKAGRAGILVGGIGTLGTGVGALAIRGWTWLNYDEDSTYDIINAEDEDDFNDKLKKYLKGKYPPELIRRIEKKNDNEMTLANFDSKNKKDVEILEFINGVIVERRKFRHEEKLLSELEEKLAKAIEVVSDTSNKEKTESDNNNASKPDKKKPKIVVKKKPKIPEPEQEQDE